MQPVLDSVSTLWALAVPFVLWSWAAARVYRRAGLDAALLLGAATGPLWFGWLLGLGVSYLPGVPGWVYAVGLPLVAGAAGLWGEPRSTLPRHALRDPRLMRLAAGVAFVLVGALVFVTLAFPARDHDILIADLFARKLSLTWDYWSLPRYMPDERGFYYPLSHPPAMMSILAWLHRWSDFGWVQRVPSAYLLAAFASSVYWAARRLQPTAGAWALVLLFSSGLYLQFLTNNSQDVYRYAAFGAAIVALACNPPTMATAVVTGLLLGLGAAVHSLQVVFVLIIPVAFAFANRQRLYVLRRSAAMLGAALAVGVYPYAANLFSFGRPLIKTGSIHDIPKVSIYLREVMSAYAQVPAEWGFVTPARLQFLGLEQGGWIGIAFGAALVAVAVLRPYAFGERRTAWWAFTFSAASFMLLVLDPGNVVLRLTETSFWSNLRYPQTAFPLLIVAGAAGVAALAARTGMLSGILLAAAIAGAVYPNWARFTPDLKAAPEPGRACVFCSDDEKRAIDRSSGLFRAVRWLEAEGQWRCATFREAEYFGYTTTLNGAPYFSPAVERALAAPVSDAVVRSLQGDGLNCVVAPAYGPMLTVLAKNQPQFTALARRSDVVNVSFYDVDLWLFGNPVTTTPVAASASTETSQSIDFDLPGPGLYAFDASLATTAAVNTVGMLKKPAGYERVWLRQDLGPQRVRFAFVAPPSTARLHFWFSDRVTFSDVRLTRIDTVEPLKGAKLPLERRPE